MKYLASIDQGTSSTRVILYDEKFTPLYNSQYPYQLNTPQPGWVDVDPNLLLSTTLDSLKDVRDHLREIDPTATLHSIGITNQRETTIIWDRISGEPLYNAIIWLDTRTSGVVKDLVDEFGVDQFRSVCGLPISTYFSAVKIKWLIENDEDIRIAIQEGRCCFGTVDCWLIWKLTGEFRTDVTNASRTMLMNLETLDWDNDMLSAFGIPREMLPEIKNSGDFFGTIKGDIFNGVGIHGCIGDQQGSLVGNLCFDTGSAKNTLGTGAFLLYNTGDHPVQSNSGLITSVGYKFGDKISYVLEGSISSVGASINWMVNNLGIIDNAKIISEIAAPANNGVYFVPAFTGILAPHWRDDAEALILGMTMNTNKSHICRALIESFAFGVQEVVECMEKDSGVKLTKLRVDGGLSNSDFIMQNQADIINVTVEIPSDVESTARGAAIAAAIGSGLYTMDEISQHISLSHQEFNPSISLQERTTLIKGWKRAVNTSLFYADQKQPTTHVKE
jgi:glycerol kinase